MNGSRTGMVDSYPKMMINVMPMTIPAARTRTRPKSSTASSWADWEKGSVIAPPPDRAGTRQRCRGGPGGGPPWAILGRGTLLGHLVRVAVLRDRVPVTVQNHARMVRPPAGRCIRQRLVVVLLGNANVLAAVEHGGGGAALVVRL